MQARRYDDSSLTAASLQRCRRRRRRTADGQQTDSRRTADGPGAPWSAGERAVAALRCERLRISQSRAKPDPPFLALSLWLLGFSSPWRTRLSRRRRRGLRRSTAARATPRRPHSIAPFRRCVAPRPVSSAQAEARKGGGRGGEGGLGTIGRRSCYSRWRGKGREAHRGWCLGWSQRRPPGVRFRRQRCRRCPQKKRRSCWH